MHYSECIIVFTVGEQTGSICLFILMRLSFIFCFLITPGNESPQDSSVLFSMQHLFQ